MKRSSILWIIFGSIVLLCGLGFLARETYNAGKNMGKFIKKKQGSPEYIQHLLDSMKQEEIKSREKVY